MANDNLNQKVFVRDLKNDLHLEQITGDDSSLSRWIIVPDINRPGLELTGYLGGSELKRVVILGNKERKYLDELDEYTQRERLNNITDVYTPCIIVSSKYGCPDVLRKIGEEKNFPIFIYHGPSYQITAEVVNYLSEAMAPSDSVHGVMMEIYGIGVLIRGESGIGKSELALDLIKKGHMLVADDRVDIKAFHNEIKATAPNVLKGMLEIRGLGIVDVALLFGVKSLLKETELDLVIDLIKYDKNRPFNRLGQEEKSIDLLELTRPLVEVPVSEGRPLASVVEAAVTNYILKSQGIDTSEVFNNRIISEIEKNKEEGE